MHRLQNNFCRAARTLLFAFAAPAFLLYGVAEVTNRVAIANGSAASKRYVVMLRRDADQDRCVGEHHIARKRIFRHAINGFEADLTSLAVEQLRKDPRVKAVEEDRIIAQQMGQIIPTGVKRMAVNNFPGVKIDGTDKRINVDVAVIDGGIQTNHPDLNVVQAVNFVPGPTPLFGSNPHGTECAGIIGALDNDFGTVGVAPGVRLWSVRHSGDNGTQYFSDTMAAVDYVAAHADQIAVASCSFGTFYGVVDDSSYGDAFASLVEKGVVVVAGAGNDGGDIAGPNGEIDDNIYGAGYTDNTLPAAAPGVLAVSGVDPITDQFAIYSNFSQTRHSPSFVNSPGAAIDVAAPANNIATTTLNSGYTLSFSGTSAATPHVAGLVALYIATHGRATNAAGVYAIRQAIIDAAQPQSQWRSVNSLDRDTNHEGMAVASLAWVTNAPKLLNIIKAAQGADVNFSTVQGYTHTLQYLSSIAASNDWANFVSTNGSGATTTVNDPAEATARFYRLATQPTVWLSPDSSTATNLGSLGSIANGSYVAVAHNVVGAIAGDNANSAVRCPVETSGGHVQIPFQAMLNPSGPFSVELWVKPVSATPLFTTAERRCIAASLERILNPGASSHYSGWVIYQSNPGFSDGNGFVFRCFNSNGDAAFTAAAVSMALDTNAWYHVVGVFDTANLFLYVNGVNSASSSIASFRPNPSVPLIFGKSTEGTSAFNGSLDEAAFYTNALSPAQVLAHYQSATNTASAVPYPQVILNDNPAGYWRLDEP
jgi:hypothetical protein